MKRFCKDCWFNVLLKRGHFECACALRNKEFKNAENCLDYHFRGPWGFITPQYEREYVEAKVKDRLSPHQYNQLKKEIL